VDAHFFSVTRAFKHVLAEGRPLEQGTKRSKRRHDWTVEPCSCLALCSLRRRAEKLWRG